MNVESNKTILWNIISYVLVFACAAFLLFGMLVLSAKIPKTSLKRHMLESAEMLCERETYFRVIPGVDSSTLHRTADAVLISIAWQFDEKNPVESILWSSLYSKGESAERNKNLIDSIKYGYKPNIQYLRYWHGSTLVVRLFHLIGNLRQMYIFGAVLMAVLFSILFMLLWKEGYKEGALALSAGAIMTAVWFTPFCLEYCWMIHLMLVSSIILVIMMINGKEKLIPYLFLLTGVIANYLDFLTTETLTFTVPVLFVLLIQHRKEGMLTKADLYKVFRMGLLWLFGYAGMWMLKWALAGAFLHIPVMDYVADHISERIGSKADLELSLPTFLYAAIRNNVKSLLPLDYGSAGIVAFLSLLVLLFYWGFVHRRKGWDRWYVSICLIVAMIPYIRYLVLHNHSAFHYAFTYRAQLASVMAVFLVLLELTDNRREWT